MAKKTKNSSLNSSIRQNTADTNAGFAQILDQQQQQMKIIQDQQLMSTIQLNKLQEIGEIIGVGGMDVRKREEETKTEKVALELKEKESAVLKNEIALKKEAIELAKVLNKLRIDESKAISNMASSIQTFQTVGDRISNMGKQLKDNFGSASALKVNAMKALNVGGIFNKSIAKEQFIQTQRKLGSDDSRKTLAGKFETSNRANIDIKKNENEISKLKQETGMSEEDLAKRGVGKELFAKREQLTDKLAGADLRAANLKSTPTEQHAESGANEERAIEAEKNDKKQEELFIKIEQNTRGDSPQQKIKPKEEEKGGGGLLGNLLGGGGIGKAIKGLKDFGVGIILVAGALWVASKAFQSFAEVKWEDVGKGLVALGGIVLAAIGLDKVKGSLISSAVGLGALALATWGISAAFKEFADLDWETIGKGFAAIISLGVVGVVLGTFAGPALIGAAALGALGAAVWLVGKGFQEMQEPFEAFIAGIEKLSNIGFAGLAGVAGGLGLLGPAMAIFAAGNVAAGLSNLVTGFLSAVTGQKSPVDQLIEIGKAGEGISKAGSGMQALGLAMKAFSGIKKEDLKALDAFPWEKATKFVAAGGSMSANGATVSNASKANADEAAKADGAKGGSTAIVNAPVNNTTRQTQIIKPQIRNQESTQSRYISSRYGII